VLLVEPERTQADLNFTLLGIPVRVHPLFWIAAVLLGMNLREPAAVLIWMVAVFIGVLCHELGHAAVIRLLGWRPWITLYGLGGLASYQPGFGPRSAPTIAQQIAISAAGPAAGFLLAAVLAGGLAVAGRHVEVALGFPLGVSVVVLAPTSNVHLNLLVNLLLFTTVAYGILNLLPVYPLDGGQIARQLFLATGSRSAIAQSLMLSLAVASGFCVIGINQYLRGDGGMFLPILFGLLAFENFVLLQAHRGSGPC